MNLYVDQYGNKVYASTVTELCRKMGYSRGTARRMYADFQGKSYHVGYVIGRYWLTMYQPIRNPA